MKKIAFYVEGQTEQFFINELLKEVAGQRNIEIELLQFQGNGRPKRQVFPENHNQSPIMPKYHALILDCMGDGGVKPRILEDYERLFAQGYTEIVGLLDLYPRLDLVRFENELTNGNPRLCQLMALPLNASILVAVNEVETWFLAECTHFTCIDSRLTKALISTNFGFDVCTDDMTLIAHPAATLHQIYQIAGKAYTKRAVNVQRTVNCLDYANIYLSVAQKIPQLNALITKINTFLTA
jgi:hypothetical protein